MSHAPEDKPDAGILSSNARADFSLPFRVLAFYVIAPIAEPQAAAERHQAFLESAGLAGRVYVHADGLNAQLSGTPEACAAYRAFASEAFGASSPSPILFKEDPVEQVAFPKLRVKHKALVPQAEGAQIMLSDAAGERGEDVSPERWAEMLEQRDAEAAAGDDSTVLLDVRSAYESDVGRFDGAVRPAPDASANFVDFDAATFGLPTDEASKAQKKVMMYCTGGIRCEYFAAALRKEGWENVYKLQGGIQHYGNVMTHQPPAGEGGVLARLAATEKKGGELDTPHWKGSLFVFDRRNVVRFGDPVAPPPTAIGECLHCSSSTEAFFNCANIDCNRLHLVCRSCLPLHRTFCCDECKSAPRRRELDLLLSEDGSVDWDAVVESTQGAAPGEVDPNRLAAYKPHNVPRDEYDADVHLRGRAARADASKEDAGA